MDDTKNELISFLLYIHIVTAIRALYVLRNTWIT